MEIQRQVADASIPLRTTSHELVELRLVVLWYIRNVWCRYSPAHRVVGLTAHECLLIHVPLLGGHRVPRSLCSRVLLLSFGNWGYSILFDRMSHDLAFRRLFWSL